MRLTDWQPRGGRRGEGQRPAAKPNQMRNRTRAVQLLTGETGVVDSKLGRNNLP